MKYIQKEEVFRDKETGDCYTCVRYPVPVALITGPGKAACEGVLLTPYAGSVPPALQQERHDEEDELAGFISIQNLFVTDTQFVERFESLGVLEQEFDLEAAMRHYEEECCSFSDPRKLADAVRRQLKEMGAGLAACQMYALLQQFEARETKPA